MAHASSSIAHYHTMKIRSPVKVGLEMNSSPHGEEPKSPEAIMEILEKVIELESNFLG